MRAFGLGILISATLLGQARAEGPRPLPPALSQLVGCWRAEGVVQGHPVQNDARGAWAIDGQYLLLRLESTTPKEPYSAVVFFGVAQQGALVVHWLDNFGGEFSKTLGRGSAVGTEIHSTFDYPDARFENRISPVAGGGWRMLVTSTAPGKPAEIFSDYTFTRRTCRAGELSL